MIFYSLLDFFPRKEQLKQDYDLLTLEEKELYKMYVYSLPWSDDDIKDLMWEYLNGYEECLFDLSRKYRIKKRKNDKRQQLYDKEKVNNEVQNNAKTE